MKTRGRTMPTVLSGTQNDDGESFSSHCCNDTIVHDPLQVTGLSVGTPDISSMPVPSTHALTTTPIALLGSDPVGESRMGAHDASLLRIRELELREREVAVRAREVELDRQALELERMSLRSSRHMVASDGLGQGFTGGQSTSHMNESKPLAHTVSSGVTLPRLEVPSYDGSPRDYWMFRKSFEANIANRVTDDATRFSYLQQYCRDKAGDAIRSCVMLSDDKAYSEAWKILEDQFGSPHRLVHALLSELLEGRQLEEKLADLQTLVRKMWDCHVSLTQMGRVRDLDCSANLLLLVKRLPYNLQAKWAKQVGAIIKAGREPVFTDLIGCIEKRIAAMDNLFGMSIDGPSRLVYPRQHVMPPREHFPKQQLSRVSAVLTKPLTTCGWCKDNSHWLGSCTAFAEATLQNRRDFIRQDKRCFICLSQGHVAKDCRSRVRCTVSDCGGRHHPLLHVTPIKSQVSVNSNVSTRRVRLSFVPVVIKGPNGEIATNAFIDSGSDVTLIRENEANQLGLKGEGHTLAVGTLHGTQTISSRRVAVGLGSLDGEFHVSLKDVYTMDRLPCSHVDRPVDLSKWSHLQDVKVETIDHSEIGLLIGCDVAEAYWVLDQRIGKSYEPHAVLTPFGWTVRGKDGNSPEQGARINLITIEVDGIEESLERMYEREFKWSEDGEAKAPSKEDARALTIVEKTTRLVEGRYEVGVPWRRDAPQLPDNRVMAERRVGLLRKRLLQNVELRASYEANLRAHMEKGYISLVDSGNIGKRWYLPHHPVVHPKKPGKVRIVFDCAAKYQGVSLNEELLNGPNLNNDLSGVLLRFREGPVATAADIEEMFLRVRLPENDRWAFSFLWWTNDGLLGDPRVFQWNVHPFGATSSPFCAAYALRKVTQVEDSEGPCSRVVEDNFYVDDCLLAMESVETATALVPRLKETLSCGGFNLTKWVSNVPAVLNCVRVEDQLTAADKRDVTDKHPHSTLGLLWDTQRDTIAVDLQISPKANTKRGVLACVASFFDPLGMVGPLLLPARMFFQRLCNKGLGWDSDLDDADRTWWADWLARVRDVPQMEFPRYSLQMYSSVASLQLHLFSDASERGYGAVAYVRALESNGRIHANFLLGKSRVAPKRAITIPRLELTAAALAVKLMRYVERETRFTFTDTWFWTDSTIVLHYLRNTSKRFKTFVANRVGYILENSKVDQWKHVPTASNPADLASRGTTKVSAIERDLWLKGPSFLVKNHEDWPHTELKGRDLSEDVEVKRVAACTVEVANNPVLSKLLLRYSTWTRMVRGAAWLGRFVKYRHVMHLNRGDNVRIGPLQRDEIFRADRCLITMIQQESFGRELALLKTTPRKVAKSDIASLKPVLREGLICLGGRVSTNLPILPQRHPAVDRMICSYHEACGHMGTTYVLADMRKKYWLVKGAAQIRRVLAKCYVCKTATAKSCDQVLATLPPIRIDQGSSPFLECGVDYFGPFEIKLGRSIHKRYGCLFTCLKTRAVHLEIAHSMSTDSFLMAFIRFIGRRGVPDNMYSDNGTNFVGAEAELRRQVESLSQQRISDVASERGVVWHFNPPHASHRGGVWERMIRTTRRVLSAVAGHQRLTDESLSTFMVETERLINDRPITPVLDDPDQPNVLRPSDILLLRANPGVVSTVVTLAECYTKAWRQSQHLASVFWKRWIREYLPTLQVSSKWPDFKREVRVGDLVLLLGGKTPYGSWPKGVVSEVKGSHDGLVRDVTIRTSSGVVTRDIRSVCLLEAVFDESH